MVVSTVSATIKTPFWTVRKTILGEIRSMFLQFHYPRTQLLYLLSIIPLNNTNTLANVAPALFSFCSNRNWYLYPLLQTLNNPNSKFFFWPFSLISCDCSPKKYEKPCFLRSILAKPFFSFLEQTYTHCFRVFFLWISEEFCI